MKVNHLFIPYLALLAFMFGSILISGGLEWYEALTLPPWNPPSGVIALIWAIIYVCAAWSLLIVWNTAAHDARFGWIMGGFGFSTLVNLLWSVLFFHFHLFEQSVWCSLVLGILVLALAMLIYPHSRRAAFLLLPYIAWVFFATYLTNVVGALNP